MPKQDRSTFLHGKRYTEICQLNHLLWTSKSRSFIKIAKFCDWPCKVPDKLRKQTMMSVTVYRVIFLWLYIANRELKLTIPPSECSRSLKQNLL